MPRHSSVLIIVLMLATSALAAAPDRTPVDDETFAQIADFYAYDAGLPLHAQVISTQTHDGRQLPYVTDKVHFRSVRDEVVVGYFTYSPDTTAAPAPVVILLHGNNRYRGSQDLWTTSWLEILSRRGYSVLAIDAYGYGDRFIPGKAPNFFGNMGPYERRDVKQQHVIDARRAIDFLYTRSEADTTRIALMGESMGGGTSCLTAGLEDRLAAVVLVITGAWGGSTIHPFWRVGATLNFAPRFSAPSLMVYSKYDGVERGQELFDNLPEPKQIIWHDIQDHVILVEEQKDDILQWLDQRLK